MEKPKVVVTRRWPKLAEDRILQLFDAKLNKDDRAMSVDELKEAMQNADALLPTVSDKITAEVLQVEHRRVRIIGNFGVGFNHIDLDAAKQLGIAVTNTPEVLTDCTADIALILLLSVARRAAEGERQLRSGAWAGWCPTHMLGTRVSAKTLGLVGFGRIAQAVARRAHLGFGMRILFFDPYPPPPDTLAELGAEPCATLEEMLPQADFLSLHCPGGDQTRHLLNAERLSLMRPGAFLINTARGDVVDEKALVAALDEGKLAGAGLDVYAHEPQITPELLQMENVVLLPHLGSASLETRIAMGRRAIDNVQAFFEGKEPSDRVV